MNDALAKRKQEPPVVQTHRALILREALEEATEQRGLLTAYVSAHMIPGSDYGVIPGTGSKPCLLKPGAEKLVELFRCTPKFSLLTKEETWEGNGFFNYMFRARIVSRDSKEVLAEGFGSANSREGKHRWRNGARKCPACGNEAIIQGKAEYGGGWLCFKKKGGCGAKYSETDPAIALQVVGKIENTDAADIANTCLKMAKKRALVDAAIALARCSDMFTQDVEDLAADGAVDAGAVPTEAPKPVQEEQTGRRESRPQSNKETRAETRAQKKSEDEHKRRVRAIFARAGDVKISDVASWSRTVLGTDKVKPTKDWTDEDFEALDKALRENKAKEEEEDDVPF